MRFLRSPAFQILGAQKNESPDSPAALWGILPAGLDRAAGRDCRHFSGLGPVHTRTTPLAGAVLQEDFLFPSDHSPSLQKIPIEISS
jgi:hypothetical protein